MGRQQKTQYIRKSYESQKAGIENKNKKEPFASLYVTMLTSEAWRNLSLGARNLYTYMKLEATGTDPEKKFQKENLKPEQFYFNRAVCKKYGFSNPNQFGKWRDELVEHGFIDLVECGRWTRTKSIYALSDRWHSDGEEASKS